MFQTGTTAASAAYRDFLTSITAAATSKHVSAAVVNAAGTGYVAGDLLTITHAGAYHDCVLEVLTVGGSGEVLTVAIRTAGAFSNRVASAVVNAAGSGYVVGDVLQVQGGTTTQWAKLQVATLSGSAVATVTVFETGGAYSVAPSATGAATLGVGPAAFAGNDAATFDLTMTGEIGTSGISASGGTGSSATFDLALTATGWSMVKDSNDRTENSVTDEKEVVLLGTAGSGDSPYVAMFTYTATSGINTRYGLACFGMVAFNPLLDLASQPGIGPLAGVVGTNAGSHCPVHEAAREWWLSISAVRIEGVIRTTDATVAYPRFYLGFMNRYGSAFTNPYPMLIGASSQSSNQTPDSANLTGPSECFQAALSTAGPMYFRRKSDGTWVTVKNGHNVSSPAQFDDNVMWPVRSLQVVNTASVPEQQMANDGPLLLTGGVIGSNLRANPSNRLYPVPNSGDYVFPLWPLTVLATNGSQSNNLNLEIPGELDGVYWFGGTDSAGSTVAPEDYFDDVATGKRYRIFPNGTQGVSSKPYQFFAMLEAEDMTFVNEQVSSVADMITKIDAFLTGTPGWTQDVYDAVLGRWAIHKTGSGLEARLALQWDVASPGNLGIYQYLGAYNTGVAPYAQADDSGNGAASTLNATLATARHVPVGSTPIQYWAFADDDYAHVVVESSVGGYAHFGVGQLAKFGDWTGGEYVYGQRKANTASTTVSASTVDSILLDGLAADGTSPTTNDMEIYVATLHVESLPNQVSGGKYAVCMGGQSAVNLGNDRQSSPKARAHFTWGFRGGPYARTLSRFDGSDLSGHLPMYPIVMAYWDRSTGDAYGPMGYMKDVRGFPTRYYEGAQEITVGGETWICFPSRRKWTGTGAHTSTSDYQGIAYRVTA